MYQSFKNSYLTVELFYNRIVLYYRIILYNRTISSLVLFTFTGVTFGVFNINYFRFCVNPIWTGGGTDLAPPVRFFSVAPEAVMEGL